VVYGNQDTADDIELGLCSLSIFLGPSKSYLCVVGCVVGFMWQLIGVLAKSQLAGAIPILLLVGSPLSWETFCLDMRKPASCGKWAKRGVQLKILMCVVLPVSLLAGLLKH
jgi:4-hydroxybenzoate polyprenyltransferase